MANPLGSGTLGGNEVPGLIQTISQQTLRSEKALNAYRNGIALPDVYIADRNLDYKPTVLGEDGQEMTFERRQALMAGKETMCDEKGELRKHLSYLHTFEDDIVPERLGESAEKNRPSIRLVRPRELELTVDIDESTVESAKVETNND